MAIEFDRFLDWAENRFPNVKVKGDEIKVDSIFDETDTKQHMWCNPNGGKHDRDNGVFHCWKTDRFGSLITLVMLVDHCCYEEAIEILNTGDADLMRLEKELDLFMNERFYDEQKKQEEQKPRPTANLPESTYLISDLPASSLHRVQCEVYLFGRGLSTDNLYVCTAGDRRNRIIIPYHNRQGKLIYWNGRYLGKAKDVLRYLGPDKGDFNVGKEDVIYMAGWPELGSRIHLTDGELDALTLKKCDLNGGAFGGKNFSELQAEMIRGYYPTLCLDNDSAGRDALPVIGDFLKTKGFVDVRYVRPPKQFKDWNKMLETTTPRLISAYIQRNEKVYDSWTGDRLQYELIR